MLAPPQAPHCRMVKRRELEPHPRPLVLSVPPGAFEIVASCGGPCPHVSENAGSCVANVREGAVKERDGVCVSMYSIQSQHLHLPISLLKTFPAKYDSHFRTWKPVKMRWRHPYISCQQKARAGHDRGVADERSFGRGVCVIEMAN